jgi:hypothetical protein
MFLYFDLIILSRYVYIFHLKNPAAFDDDFWALFLNLWVTFASLCFKGTVHFIANQVTISWVTFYRDCSKKFVCSAKKGKLFSFL